MGRFIAFNFLFKKIISHRKSHHKIVTDEINTYVSNGFGSFMEGGGTHPSTLGDRVEIYLIYTKLSKQEAAGNIHDFFNRDFKDVDRYISKHLAFFKKAEALEHNQFIGTQNIILKATVPSSAIVSKNQQLTLKSGYLHSENICGCYHTFDSARCYYENPLFNEKLVTSSNIMNNE